MQLNSCWAFTEYQACLPLVTRMTCCDWLIPTALQGQRCYPSHSRDRFFASRASKGAPNQCDNLSLEIVCVFLACARKCTGFTLHAIEFSWHFLHSKASSVKEYYCDWHAGTNSLSSHRGNTVSGSGWKRSGPVGHSFTYLFKNTCYWASLSKDVIPALTEVLAMTANACEVPAICQVLL